MENDPIIEQALRDLEQHRCECRRLEEFLSRYGDYKQRLSGSLLTKILEPRCEPRRQRSTPADKVISVVHDILEDRGDALTLSAIFNALCSKGIVIGGGNPKQNLSQKLSASPDVKSYGKRGWYFADTIPPCLQVKQLDDESLEYEEGPTTEMTRPSQSNGAASAN